MENKEFLQRHADNILVAHTPETVPPSTKDYDGPCRESSASIIGRKIREAESRLAALKHMQDIVRKMPPEAEEYFWELLCRDGGRPY
jgi:hypothetical protein